VGGRHQPQIPGDYPCAEPQAALRPEAVRVLSAARFCNKRVLCIYARMGWAAMQTALIEFQADGGPVVVEVEASLVGPRPAAAGEIAARASKSFAEALAGIKPIAEAMIKQLADLGPAEAKIEFGVKFTAKAGVVLASAESEAHCKITLGWIKPTK
jgi:hypothetical protein